MPFGLLAIAAVPTSIGVWQTLSEGKKAKKDAADERRMQKFNLEIYCSTPTPCAKEVHGKLIVLRNNKLYLDFAEEAKRDPRNHVLAAFFIAYPPSDPDAPSKSIRGLVSTISNDPPMLNWIYADGVTGELKYGNRTQSKDHVPGSWDWTEDLEGVTLEGNEAFCVVEEEEEEEEQKDEKEGGRSEDKNDEGVKKEEKGKVWAVYYDREGDGLRSLGGEKNGATRRVLEVSLERKVVG